MLKLLAIFGAFASVILLWIASIRSPFAYGAPSTSMSSESSENLNPLIAEFISNTQRKSRPLSLAMQDEDNLSSSLKEFIQHVSKELDDRNSKDTSKKPSRISQEKSIPINSQPQFLKKDNCSCVNFYKCDVGDVPILESAEGEEEDEDLSLINIRLNVPEGGCGHYLEICCDKFKKESQLPTLPKLQKKARVCGDRNPEGIGFRILGGKQREAQFGEFPWMAAITKQIRPRYPDDKTHKYIGGGSLIHPRVVMTAAHVVKNFTVANHLIENLSVRLGEWDTQTEKEIYPHQDSKVEKIIIHKDYRRNSYLKNDIALVVLKDEIELAPNIAPVCLPKHNANFDGMRCQASGWGIDDYTNDGPNPVILKKIDLPIVPRDKCQETLRQTRLKNTFKLDTSFVCAGGEKGIDTCKGDGGSPLVCHVPDTTYYIQYGIVAWGLGCGEPIPGVYVNVPAFVPWINDQMDLLGLDKSFYTP